MMGKLKVIMLITICVYYGRCENDTFSTQPTEPKSQNNLTDYTDYEYLDSDEMPVNMSSYLYMEVTIEQSTEFLNGTTTVKMEDTADSPTTPLNLIKPAVTLETPKPGVAVLSYDDNNTSTQRPVIEISELLSTEFECEIDHTELPEVTLQAPDGDLIDITNIKLKIDEITEKLRVDSAKGDVDMIQELHREIAADMTTLKDEIDLVLKGKGVVSKTFFDLQTRYLHLQQEMWKLNDTLNTRLQQEDWNRVETVLSLLNQNRTIEAAEEALQILDIGYIGEVFFEFHKCNRENILVLIEFTYHLSDPTLTEANTQASSHQLMSLLSLYLEMKRCNQNDDPGILAIKDMVVAIHALEEFPVIKHNAGIFVYDAFRDDVENDASQVLTKWQCNMVDGKYDDIVKFALRSAIYSESLNNNMIRLVWAPISFETNNEFLKALPGLSNRMAGYSYLNIVYKNHHRYEEMIKLAVTVKSDFEKNLEDIDDYDLNGIKQQFWIPVRKLIWSESCTIKNRYTGKYLFEFMKTNDRSIATYSVETVRWKGSSLRTNNDFHWRFVPDEVVPGKFGIQNMGHSHYLAVEEKKDGSFKYWPRRMVKTSNSSSKQNQTKQWTVILSDKDELFSFKNHYGFLTGGNASFVYAEDKPKIANISEKEDKTEFLHHHQWDIECS